MIKIKGSVLKSRLALIEEVSPGDGLAQVLEQMSSEDTHTLRTLLDSSWYPFELGKRLDEAVVQAIGEGKPEFFERIGEASATKNLGGVHKRFLVEGDPKAFLERTPMIYSFYYDQGHRECEFVGPTEAVLTTHEAETFSGPDCLTVIGWYRKALQLCGADNPQIAEEECRARGGNVCRYRVTWG